MTAVTVGRPKTSMQVSTGSEDAKSGIADDLTRDGLGAGASRSILDHTVAGAEFLLVGVHGVGIDAFEAEFTVLEM